MSETTKTKSSFYWTSINYLLGESSALRLTLHIPSLRSPLSKKKCFTSDFQENVLLWMCSLESDEANSLI